MPTVLVHFGSANEAEKTESREFIVDKNLTIFDQLESQGLKLPHGCLAGSCGSCRIQVINGSENLSKMSAVEADTVSHIQEQYPGKCVRLSCRAKILGDVEITPLK